MDDTFPMPCLTCCVLDPDGTVYRDLFGPCEDCGDRGYIVYTVIPPIDHDRATVECPGCGAEREACRCR